jgi:hypothetical protein
MNEAEVELSHLMNSKNLAPATTFSKHKKYATWRSLLKNNKERTEDGDPQANLYIDRSTFN